MHGQFGRRHGAGLGPDREQRGRQGVGEDDQRLRVQRPPVAEPHPGEEFRALPAGQGARVASRADLQVGGERRQRTRQGERRAGAGRGDGGRGRAGVGGAGFAPSEHGGAGERGGTVLQGGDGGHGRTAPLAQGGRRQAQRALVDGGQEVRAERADREALPRPRGQVVAHGGQREGRDVASLRPVPGPPGAVDADGAGGVLGIRVGVRVRVRDRGGHDVPQGMWVRCPLHRNPVSWIFKSTRREARRVTGAVRTDTDGDQR